MAKVMLVVVILLGLQREAAAGAVLVSAPHAFASTELACLVTNVGRKDVGGRIEIFNFDGMSLLSGPFSIAPNKTYLQVALPGPQGNPTLCRIVLENGSRKDVTATVQLRETSTGGAFFLPVR